ncbi:MAG: prepilin-type N-terminal cleavage/methylation domain-containing protein [Myxococcota bacterium]
MTESRTNAAGFTLIEVATVCAIVGVLALLAYPNMVRFKEQQQTKAGATQIAGVLDTARSRASHEATPYLVYFNERSVDASGNCGPAATMVRDADRTYTVTAGDDVHDVTLPKEACEKVKPYDESASSTLGELRLPLEDLSTRSLGLLGLTEGEGEAEGEEEDSSGSGSSGSGSSGTGSGEESTVSTTRVADVVVNGATFPIDDETGRPVIAFSERGIPVDPSNPTSWGSGAGAIYMTDGRSTVYAAIVQPLGNVQLRVFDSVRGEWR